MKTRKLSRPKPVLLHLGLLPGWVAKDHIKARAFSQKNLRERYGKVEWRNGFESLDCQLMYRAFRNLGGIGHPVRTVLRKAVSYLLRDAGCCEDIEQGSRRGHLLSCLSRCCPRRCN